jgi:hypothetical protein
MTILGKLRRASHGQAAVEFALVLPLLVLLLVGIFDLGRAVYAYSTATNAAREAGRVAIVDQTLAHIQDRAAEHGVAIAVDPTSVAVDYRDEDTPDVADSCPSDPGEPGITTCIAVVQVPYTYTAATPIVSNLVGTIQITGEARFPVAFSCLDPAPDPPIVCPVGD